MSDTLYMRALRIPSLPTGERVRGTAEELPA
jgi:hypothetical protein